METKENGKIIGTIYSILLSRRYHLRIRTAKIIISFHSDTCDGVYPEPVLRVRVWVPPAGWRMQRTKL